MLLRLGFGPGRVAEHAHLPQHRHSILLQGALKAGRQRVSTLLVLVKALAGSITTLWHAALMLPACCSRSRMQHRTHKTNRHH